MRAAIAIRTAGLAAASCIALAGCHSGSGGGAQQAGDATTTAPSPAATHDPATGHTRHVKPRTEAGPVKPTKPAVKPSGSDPNRKGTKPGGKSRSTKPGGRKAPGRGTAPSHPEAPGLQHTLAPSAKPGGAPTAGAEGATAKATGQCKITGGQDVAQAFGGKVDTVSGSTSGTGNPLCRITLTDSNAGAPGVVSLSLTASANRATFAQVQRSMHGQVVAGLGDQAFYLPHGETLRFLSGHTVVALQADIRVPGGPTRSPERVKADLLILAKRIAASL